MMAPNGSMVVPSHPSISETRRPGRALTRSGATTVGPETMMMAPSMIAAWSGQPEQGAGEEGAAGPRDGDSQVEQAAHDPLVVSLQFAELEIEPAVEQDDRHGKRDQRRERRTQAFGGIHGVDEMAGEEPHRQ